MTSSCSLTTSKISSLTPEKIAPTAREDEMKVRTIQRGLRLRLEFCAGIKRRGARFYDFLRNFFGFRLSITQTMIKQLEPWLCAAGGFLWLSQCSTCSIHAWHKTTCAGRENCSGIWRLGLSRDEDEQVRHKN
jgi:hypothetical protein